MQHGVRRSFCFVRPLELALEARAYRAPTQIPWTLYMAAPLAAKLSERWGPRDQWPVPTGDLIRILWEVEVEDLSPALFRDRFGCEWIREQGGYIFKNPQLKEPDARKIPRIQLLPDADIARIF